MKHPKKKKRPRPPISKSKLAAGCQNPIPGQIDDRARGMNGLAEGIASFSIEEAMTFSNRDDAAAEIVGNLTETASSSSANRDDDAAEIFGNLTETASSSSGSSGLSNCDVYNRRIGGKVTKGSRGNKVIAATGMVSTVIGKDYVPTSTRRRGVPKWKGSADGAVSHEDAEQFLCSMLSDDCELGMDLVKDVLLRGRRMGLLQMAMQAASPAAVLPSAQVVGNAFVEQYYHILHQSPELVHKFYQDSSILSRPDTNGLMSSVTTMQAIDEKIQSLDYKNYKAEIKTADAQDSYQAGVIVLVTGCLTGKDSVKRKFAQTFFLAPQEKGYFVQNDVFRYVEESAPLETTSASVEDIVDSAPVDHALPNAGQSAYDVEKALDILLELSAPTSELSKGGQHHNLNQKSEDTRSLLESSNSLTRTSDLASSSESDLQGNVPYMGCNDRNYFDVLASCGTHRPSGPRSSSEVTQDVLESLFNTRKSSKHEPDSMNWRNVVKKMESLGQMLDYPSENTAEKQHVHAKGDDYQNYRNTASQHWDSMKSYYHKAATAYANGKREYAAYLSDQGRMCNEKARQADERASQDIFNSRNKSIENVITIDLHGQHVKQGMKLLKLHLLFGAYVRSVRLFRVITGCGSHGLGKSKLKQSVVNLLEMENIEWKEENRGTLLIKLNGQREFSFLDSDSDTE